jgi:hypothetical protein
MPTPVKKASKAAAKPAVKRQARSSSRPAAIVPVSAEGKYVRMLIYGDPGSGKSVLAGTSPRALMLVNDPDEVSSPALHGSTADRWHVADYADLTDAIEYLRHGGTADYDWVWFDNATLFQEQGMDQIMVDLVARRETRNQFIPDKPEYLENQNRLGTAIRVLKGLPINFGITAHVMRVEDEDGKVVYMPLFQGGQGALSQKICGYMGLVGYMSSVRVRDPKGSKKVIVERRLLTDKRSKYYAKDRYSSSPSGSFVNTTIPDIMKAIGNRRVPVAKKSSSSTTKKRSTT